MTEKEIREFIKEGHVHLNLRVCSGILVILRRSDRELGRARRWEDSCGCSPGQRGIVDHRKLTKRYSGIHNVCQVLDRNTSRESNKKGT